MRNLKYLLVLAHVLVGLGVQGQSSTRVSDAVDMADSSGDIAGIGATVIGDFLHLTMTVHGTAAPTVDQTPEGMKNRYYYHWLVDTDNNPAVDGSPANTKAMRPTWKLPLGQIW